MASATWPRAIPLAIPAKKTPSPTPKARPSVKKSPVKKPVRKQDQNQFRTVLPQDIDETYCNEKLLSLVHDAKLIDLGDAHYTGMALMRMLFETSVVHYAVRTKKYNDLRLVAVKQREKDMGRPLTADQLKNFVPKAEELVDYLIGNRQIWGVAKSQHLKNAATRMKLHKSTLNSALHNPFQTQSRETAFIIRDEILPMLRHLIEEG